MLSSFFVKLFFNSISDGNYVWPLMFLLFCIEIPLGFFLGHKIMNIMLDNIKLPTLLASLLRHIGHQLP
jgi:hypothetical protein